MSELLISFNDSTILESDGYFDKISELVDPSGDLELWLVKSEFGLVGNGVDSFGSIDFWKNGEAVITGYMASVITDYVPTDLMFVYEWLKERGWKLMVDDSLRAMAMDFWSRFDGMVMEDDIDEIDIDDDVDFLEYQKMMRENRRPKIGTFKITDLDEFSDHKEDHRKRDGNEDKRIF